jgi:hypothetical protein
MPVIDCVITELEAQFSDYSSTVIIEIQALTPKQPSFFEFVKIAAFAQLYHGTIEDASHEVQLSAEMFAGARRTDNVVHFVTTGSNYSN